VPGQVLSADAYNTQLGPDGDLEYEDMNRDGVIDDRDRKRSFDDAFDDGSPPPAGGSSSVVFTEPSETPVFPAPADPQPAPADPQPGAPSLGEEVAVTAESLILLMNPLAASVIADNMQTGHFHRMDERASKVAAMWNALTGNQYADGSVRIPLSQTIIDGLAVAQHAIEFASVAVRRDLAGDGYHDQTGARLWTQPRHDDLYSHPSLGTNTERIAHLGSIVILKRDLKAQVDDSPGDTYEGRLGYLEHLKVTFDAYVEFAFDEWDYHRTQVKLDYLRAYEEYSSYLLVATNYHKSTIDTWRPTTMPDIVNIPNLYGFAPYTRTLEPDYAWLEGTGLSHRVSVTAQVP